MQRGRWLLLALAASVAATSFAASSASAAFHLMKIREVHPGGASGGSYVVLQMYSGSQNFVFGHDIAVYGAGGSLAHEFVFPGNVSNGASQATILVAGEGYEAAFPSGPAPDFADSGLDIPASGGAVCFPDGTPPDCVSWGNFTGDESLPSTAGDPVSPGGVTTGKALHRSIEPGCETLLEAGDDSNDSATDFFERDPEPRSNSSEIVEHECVAPNTTIDSAPVPNGGRTSTTEISFSFSAAPPEGASFECKLDVGAYEACTSPQEYNSLDGSETPAGTLHTFRVRAKNADGTDPSPATHSWTVDTIEPTITITAQPEDPSSGASASFSYVPNESVTGTQCRLDTPAGEGTFEACPSGGRTYLGLDDGAHTFMVRATDLAGNQSTPGEFPAGTYDWTVDNSLADTTPPQTTIVLRPPNPSGSSTALFTYVSSEPGSTFECSLDGAPFEACPSLGKAYTGLTSGTHTFEVRARDASDNPDPTPAGYTFNVVLSTPSPGPPPAPPPPAPSPPEPEPGTAFAAGVAPVKGAFALLRMGCRGPQGARCAGVLRLLVRVGRARSSRARRSIVVGRASYGLPAGSRGRVVRVKLRPRGRRLVRRVGKRGLRVRLVGKRLKRRSLRLRATAKRRQARR